MSVPGWVEDFLRYRNKHFTTDKTDRLPLLFGVRPLQSQLHLLKLAINLLKLAINLWPPGGLLKHHDPMR
jgi:hypothetical protein